MSDIRIKDLPETLDVESDDYVAVDNAGDGTRKYTLRRLIASVGVPEFVVNVSASGEADKTLSEITSAIASGYVPVAAYNDEYYQLTKTTETSATFTKYNELGEMVFITVSGESVLVEETPLTTDNITNYSGATGETVSYALDELSNNIGYLSDRVNDTYNYVVGMRDDISDLDTRVTTLENEGGGGGSGLTDDVKTALLQIAQKIAYIDAHGQDYYDDLYDALYSSTTRSVLLVLSHVSSSNTQSTVEVGDSYTTILTASTNYTLNSVSVTMGGVDVTSTSYSSGTVSIPSVTGNIVITATAVLAAQSITATYTQSGTVYNTDTLESLKSDLVVTANYAGGTSETLLASDYTLSGMLTVGTSTVTVNYAGLTDTFSVTVTKVPNYVRDGLQGYWAFENVAADYLGDLTNLADNGDLKAQALYAHNYNSGTPFNHVIDGEFLSTNYYFGGIAPNHCPTAIRISKESTHPQFYTTYPYSVEWYGKFVGDKYDGTTFRRAFSYATTNQIAPVLINTRNGSNPDTSLFSNGGTGTIVTIQNGSYVSYGSVGQGNNTITDANMTPESYHHYVITVDKTSMKIYVDGTLVGEGTATNNNLASDSQGLLVGMNTLIKFVRVYNKILSAQEVATNYSDAV